jgi:hypothetical protein
MFQRAFFVLVLFVAVAASAAAQTDAIRSIRTVPGGVELEVHSAREFDRNRRCGRFRACGAVGERRRPYLYLHVRGS